MNRSHYNTSRFSTMQEIAAKATLSGLGTGRIHYPVKKPTKFIVTLRPIEKELLTNPYKTVPMCSKEMNSCDCTTVKLNNKVSLPSEKLRDKALHASSILSNSKFITFDPNYNEECVHVPLTYSFSRIRLMAGNDIKQKKLNTLQHSIVPTVTTRPPAANKTANKATDAPPPEPKRRFSFFKSSRSSKTKKRKDKNKEAPAPPPSRTHMNELNNPRHMKTDSGLVSGLTSESQISRAGHRPHASFLETSQLSSDPPPPLQSTRIKQLEQQVQAMRSELNRIKEDVLPQNQTIRCGALTDKLNELNSLLSEMREQYFSKSQPEDVQQGNFFMPSCELPSTTAAAVQVDSPATKLRTFGTQADLRETASTCVQMDASSETFLMAMGCSCTNINEKGHTPTSSATTQCSGGAQTKPEVKVFKKEKPPPLPCNLGKKGLDPVVLEESSYCLFCEHAEVPTVTTNLFGEILQLIENQNPNDIALTILLQPNNLYHINVAKMQSGDSLGCLYASEGGIQEANEEHLFEEFLTFFIVDARNTLDQKNRILDHTFEFIRN